MYEYEPFPKDKFTLEEERILFPRYGFFLVTDRGREDLQRMRNRGCPKPRRVSWGDYTSPIKLKRKHKEISILNLAGYSVGQIAEAMEMTFGRIEILLSASLLRRYSLKVHRKLSKDRLRKLARRLFNRRLGKK